MMALIEVMKFLLGVLIGLFIYMGVQQITKEEPALIPQIVFVSLAFYLLAPFNEFSYLAALVIMGIGVLFAFLIGTIVVISPIFFWIMEKIRELKARRNEEASRM